MKRGTAIRKTQGSSIGGVSEEEKKKSSSAEDRGRALTFPLTTLLTIQFPNNLARPLKASSQRPSSQARFSTNFIVLGLLGLGLLTFTVKGAPQIGTLQLVPSVGRTCVLVRAIVEHGGIRPPSAWANQIPIGGQFPKPWAWQERGKGKVSGGERGYHANQQKSHPRG